MSTILHPHRTGVAWGILLGAWHLCWVILVFTGWAQPVLDFIFRLHFITPVYKIEPFQWSTALGLIALTTAIGYGMAAGFAWIWNRLHR